MIRSTSLPPPTPQERLGWLREIRTRTKEIDRGRLKPRIVAPRHRVGFRGTGSTGAAFSSSRSLGPVVVVRIVTPYLDIKSQNETRAYLRQTRHLILGLTPRTSVSIAKVACGVVVRKGAPKGVPEGLRNDSSLSDECFEPDFRITQVIIGAAPKAPQGNETPIWPLLHGFPMAIGLVCELWLLSDCTCDELKRTHPAPNASISRFGPCRMARFPAGPPLGFPDPRASRNSGIPCESCGAIAAAATHPCARNCTRAGLRC